MNYKKRYFNYYGLYECDPLFCANCGQLAVNLHHLIYKSHGGSDEPDNLIPLCFKCHDSHHTQNKPTKEELLKLKRRD